MQRDHINSTEPGAITKAIGGGVATVIVNSQKNNKKFPQKALTNCRFQWRTVPSAMNVPTFFKKKNFR